MSTTIIAPVSQLASQVEKITLINDDVRKFSITRDQTKAYLWKYVDKLKPGLKLLYPTLESLDPEVDKAMKMAEAIWAKGKGCTTEIARELQVLVLYDLVMLIDDSSSMHYDQGGQRKVTLEKTLKTIASVYTHARPQGLNAVRFINGNTGKRNVKRGHVRGILKDHEWRGATRIGTQLERKILNDFVYTNLKRPLLIMIITDGAVEGEEDGLLKKVIQGCTAAVNQSLGECGADNVAFHFSRVGNDQGAADLLKKLDDDSEIGDNVDCLPSRLLEPLLFKCKIALTPIPVDDDNSLDNLDNSDNGIKWNLIGKLLLGAIHPDWDYNDETRLVKADISDYGEEEPASVKDQGVRDEECGEEEDSEAEEET
ncbi:hypothetical protein EDC01DRAFT_345840 [Geopyxis carbonaria]|nr:hypothetical protein EDC01DRAFT_345840 [Geopyxis carbonaria]